MGLAKNNNVQKANAAEVYRNEAFDIGFYQYFKNAGSSKISLILNDKERNIKTDDATYRQLNSWEKEGLLTTHREGREWRRFSIMDAVWVKLLKELREFGMSREQLKTTKQSLEFESAKCGVAMPLLEFYTAFAIATKMPVLVLIFKDGLAVPANFTQYKIAQQVQGMENHIQLSLNDILQGFFPDVNLKAKYKNELPMSVNEMELLAYLRIANFERITVKFNNGQMEKFEGVQRLKAKKRIEELIREHRYQDIQLQEEDGEVTAIFQTIKKKFTKGSNPK